jgi:opacity protein-like surface antigen
MTRGKFAALACFLMLTYFPLSAQWEIGGLIDFNLASISVPTGTSSENYSGRFGFGIGLVADRQLTEFISLHAEPMYLQKGGTIETSYVKLVFKVNYIEFPIMFKYAFPIKSPVTPYAMAGPSLGLMINAKYVDEEGYTQDEKDNTNVFDFGLGFGGGVSMPYGKLTLFAETRYVLGLANINKESDESKVKNRGLQILLGVAFPIGTE